MSQDKIQKADTQDLSLVVRAIGADLEHTQIHLIYPLSPKERRLGKQSH